MLERTITKQSIFYYGVTSHPEFSMALADPRFVIGGGEAAGAELADLDGDASAEKPAKRERRRRKKAIKTEVSKEKLAE